MIVKDITDYIESLFPLETAAGFDNPGLLVGSKNTEVTRVLVCLDATSMALDAARELNCEMIFAHHPLIFGGINNVCTDFPKGKIISDLLRGGISCYSAHTNLDANDEYSNILLAKALGADSVWGSDEVFCGVIGELKEEVSIKDFCENAKTALNASGVITYSMPDKKVKKIFAQGGAFDEDAIPFVIKNNVDTVVSGEIKHHIMLELEDYGIKGVIAGHNSTERIFMKNISEKLNEVFPEVEFVYFDGTERTF